MNHTVNRIPVWTSIGVFLVLIFLSVAALCSSNIYRGYEVSAQGVRIGFIHGREPFENSAGELQRRLKDEYGVNLGIMEGGFEYEQQSFKISDILNGDVALPSLIQKIGVLTTAGVIVVDGVEKVVVGNKVIAEHILQGMLQEIPDKEKYIDVGFVNDIAIKEREARLEEVSKVADAIRLLKTEGHIIIRTKEKAVLEEDIPFEEVVYTDAKLAPGERKLVSRGYPGKKEVEAVVTKYNGIEVCRDIIKEKIITKPVNSKIAAGTATSKAEKTQSAFSNPARGSISSRFGMRDGRLHQGIDIAANFGDNIYSAEKGTVTFAEWYAGYGRLITIQHEGGLATYYGHCSKILVKKGQKVSKGQKIGLVGDSGMSNGPHLHFEVRKNGVPQNPENYFK